MKCFAEAMRHVEHVLEEMHRKRLVFWGAGRRWHEFLIHYCDNRQIIPRPDYICDSTRTITEEAINGIPVADFDQIKQFSSDDTIILITAGLLDLPAQVISNEMYYFPLYHCRSIETYCFLKENWDSYEATLQLFDDDRSRHVYQAVLLNQLVGCLWCQSLFEPSPYFGNDLVGDLADDEFLVFAGALNGRQVDRALSNNPKIGVHAFEPNEKWYDVLCQKYRANPGVTIENRALWDHTATLCLHNAQANGGLDASVCAATDQPGDWYVQGIDLDSAVGQKPTLIALDVEGAEQRVLRGAENLILRNRPKLAVCLYHQFNDFIQIPALLRDMDLDRPYQLHVRQHSCISAIETVLYAL